MNEPMTLSVRFTPAEVRPSDVEGAAAIVIDVVRATSCIAEALAAGAASVHPAVSVDEAVRLRGALEGPAADGGNGAASRPLLCGERHGLRIEGFDLGNSPAEFTPEAVGGRPLVMTTTNGTRALASVEGARRVLSASFLNLGAIAAAVRRERAVVIVCAGKEGRFAMDDVVCAGHIVKRVLDGRGALPDGDRGGGPAGGGAVALDESAQAALQLAGVHGISGEMLAGTAAGQALIDVGLGGDLELCARVDLHAVVPEMQGGRLTAAPQ